MCSAITLNPIIQPCVKLVLFKRNIEAMSYSILCSPMIISYLQTVNFELYSTDCSNISRDDKKRRTVISIKSNQSSQT